MFGVNIADPRQGQTLFPACNIFGHSWWMFDSVIGGMLGWQRQRRQYTCYRSVASQKMSPTRYSLPSASKPSIHSSSASRTAFDASPC